MSDETKLIIAAPPDAIRDATSYALPVAHIAYRIGSDLQLLRSNIPINLRAGLMVISCSSPPKRGDIIGFCRQVVRECSIRNFDGIILDFECPSHPLLEQIIATMDPILAQRGWPLFVPEQYAGAAAHTKIMIPSALSGGSLQQRIFDAAAQFGPQRLSLSIQRVAEDFTLPAPSGCGTPIDRETLKQYIQAHGANIYFSTELCAYYFTYMSRGSAHFVLFDTANSLKQKIKIAKTSGLHACILAWPEISDEINAILS